MKRIFYIISLLAAVECSFAQNNFTIQFANFVNKYPLVLNDSVYINSSGEKYTVSKLKYYVSDIHLVTDKKEKFLPNVFLVDASGINRFTIPKVQGKIIGIEFLLGVDSAMNCSGAQNGALDPLNDMFWTWDNGYVMFKLEGISVASSADQNRIQYHIGGYKGAYKTIRKVFLPITCEGSFTSPAMVISLNLDSFWAGENKIQIAESPVIMSQGPAASKAADNFSGMFSIRPY